MSEVLKKIKEYHYLSALLLFSFLALIFNYPLAGKISQAVPKGGGDVYQALANISLRVNSLEKLSYGEKIISLMKHPDTFTPYVKLNLLFPLPISYNIMFFLSFILSAWGAYLLAFYFTKNRLASLLAGIFFAFSPFHFYQSTSVHLGTMHQEWLPFLAWFLFRFFEKFEFKFFVGVLISSLLIAVSEHQLVAFTLPFIFIFIIFQLTHRKELIKNRKLWIYILISCLIFSLVAIFFFGYLIKIALSGDNYLDAGLGSARKYAMNLFDPVVPPAFHAFWPQINHILTNSYSGLTESGSYFIGFSVLALLTSTIIKASKHYGFRWKNYLVNQSLIFWGITALIYLIFSLGPAWAIKKHLIYLPYYLIYRFVPFYENIRVTGRFFVWASLSIAIIIALIWNHWKSQIKGKKYTYLSLIFALLMLLEFWVAPISLQKLDYSPFYDRLAKERGNFSILEVPGSTDYDFASLAMFTATIHRKDSINGMPFARKIKDQFEFQQTTPIIKQLLYTIPKGNDPDKKNPPEYYNQANKLLSQYQIRYITFNKKYLDEKTLNLGENFVQKYIRYEEKYEDQYLVAYKIAWPQ